MQRSGIETPLGSAQLNLCLDSWTVGLLEISPSSKWNAVGVPFRMQRSGIEESLFGLLDSWIIRLLEISPYGRNGMQYVFHSECSAAKLRNLCLENWKAG